MSGQNSLFVKIIEIDVFKSDKESNEDKVIHEIQQRYPDSTILKRQLTIIRDEARLSLNFKSINGFFVSRSTIEYGVKRDPEKELEEDQHFPDLSGLVSESLQMNPINSFTLFIESLDGRERPQSQIENFSEHLSLSVECVSIYRDVVVSIFESIEGGLNQRYFLLSPITSNPRYREQHLEEATSIIEQIAIKCSMLWDLEERSKNFFSTLDIGEMEISERVEGYLGKLLGPEVVELETLESWLSYIVEMENTLIATIGGMKVNYTEAESILDDIAGLFIRLKWAGLEGYPDSPELVVYNYRRALRTFDSYIVRVEALKSRLGTLMDEVRTYLSLQQQKLAIEGQKSREQASESSREQLMRLVNVQEIFRKVEIFIVAFYLTEMAHRVFEVVSPERSTLWTALFIPVALVLAIFVSRILHNVGTKKPNR